MNILLSRQELDVAGKVKGASTTVIEDIVLKVII